jgi:hypothetical protein
MADDAPDPNRLVAEVSLRSTRTGDVPEPLLRRYFTDGRGGGLGFYPDPTTTTPAFRDRGDRLTTARNDPNAIRHMAQIAQHREWAVVLVRGSPEFRREAWLAGRVLGLDVRGYRPTERDIQALQRKLATDRDRPKDADPPTRRSPPRDPTVTAPGPRSHMRAVEAVVRARVQDPADQARILAGARNRLAAWLERGAQFDEIATPRRREHARSDGHVR